jgi:hypothetical protein
MGPERRHEKAEGKGDEESERAVRHRRVFQNALQDHQEKGC